MTFNEAVEQYIDSLTQSKYKTYVKRATERFGNKQPTENDYEVYRAELEEQKLFTGKNAKSNLTACITQIKKFYMYLAQCMYDTHNTQNTQENQDTIYTHITPIVHSTQRFNFNLPSEKYNDLKTLAKVKGVSVTQILENLIDKYLSENVNTINEIKAFLEKIND